MFAVFALKIKVSIILKMTQWNFELTKQTWPVCELGTLLLFDYFLISKFAFGPENYQAFRDTGPRKALAVLFKSKFS